MREGGGFHLSYKELLAGNACEGGVGVLYTDTHKCYRKTGTDVVTRREGPIGPRVCVEGGGRGGTISASSRQCSFSDTICLVNSMI